MGDQSSEHSEDQVKALGDDVVAPPQPLGTAATECEQQPFPGPDRDCASAPEHRSNRPRFWWYLGVILLASMIVMVLWRLLELPAYRSTEDLRVDAQGGYQHHPEPGCSLQELMQLSPGLARAAQTRICANQAQNFRRELENLAQQTRAAEAAQQANWLSEAHYNLSRIQLILSVLGTAGLLYTLYLTRMATGAAERGGDAAAAAVREAQRSNEIAARTAAIDQRPWLSVSDFRMHDFKGVDPNEPAPVQIWFSSSFTIKNSGTTPAFDVAYYCKVRNLDEWKLHDPVEWVSDFDIMESDALKASRQRPAIIAPNSELRHTQTQMVTVSNIPAGQTGSLVMEARVMVVYRWGVERQLAVTSQDYFVVQKYPGNATPFSISLDLLAEASNELQLDYSPYGAKMT